MIKIWLMGGLGNIFFQMFAHKIIKNKTQKEVKFITILTERNIITKAIKWSIHQNVYTQFIASKDIVKESYFNAFIFILIGFISKLTGFFFSYASFYNDKLILERNPLSKNVFGYFQEKEFLKNNKDELIEFGKEIREKMNITNNNLSVVHFRLGDSSWAFSNKKYYEKVKAILMQTNEKVFVVTDSYHLAKDFFQELSNVEVVNSASALNDFKLMLQAKTLYCAPSTFSWWAAHTLPEDCRVVVPSFLNELLGFYVECNIEII